MRIIVYIAFMLFMMLSSAIVGDVSAQISNDSGLVIDTHHTTINTLTPIAAPIKTFDKIAVHKTPRPQSYSHTLIFYILCALLILVGIVRLIDTDIISRIVKTHFSTHLGVTSIREKFNYSNLSIIILFFTALLAISLFAYLASKYFLFNMRNHHFSLSWIEYIQAMGIMLGLLGLRMIMVSLLGYFFDHRSFASISRLQIILTFILIGIMSIPISMLMMYSDSPIDHMIAIVGIAIFIILVIIGLARIMIFFGHILTQNRFHFFLYLCTAEIIPVALLIKYMSNNL